MREIEEITLRAQRRIRKLLRRLDVAQESSETVSVGAIGLPHASDASHSGDFIFRLGVAWEAGILD